MLLAPVAASVREKSGLDDMGIDFKTGILIGLVFLVSVTAIYSNTLHSPFIFDDYRHINANPHIRIENLSPASLWDAGFNSPLRNRPVANISLALNYYFHGYKVVGYHIVNIAVHAAAGIFLFMFVRTTLMTPALREQYADRIALPFVAALLWVLHPLHTQSVTYIVQRMNSLATLFFIITLFFYAEGRLAGSNKRAIAWFSGCALAALLAFGSKETAFTLPLFVFLYELFFFGSLDVKRLQRISPIALGVVAFYVAGVFIFYDGHPVNGLLATYDIRDFTLPERVLTESRVVIFYVSLLFWPHPGRLNLDHDILLSRSLLEPPTTLLSLVVLAGLFVAALFFAKRYRLQAFCILWFLGNLVIESSVVGLELIFEHRTYLPSMLVPLLVLVPVGKYLKSRRAKTGLVCLLLALLAFWTFERNKVWQDELTLRFDCLKKSPAKPRVHAILANVLERQGRLDEAAGYYLSALALNPSNADEIHYNLGNVMFRLGRLKEAAAQYRRVIQLDAANPLARLNLGVVLERQGLLEQAVAEYRELLRQKPDFARGHNNLGNVFLKLGRIDEAVASFSEAVRLKPNYGQARRNLARALEHVE